MVGSEPAAKPLPPASATLHGSCVRWLERGILLRGPSGSGKSDLLVRLLHSGGRLIADDLVPVRVVEGVLEARTPEPRGLIELRGFGIFRIAAGGRTRVDLLVEMAQESAGSRLPEVEEEAICGVPLPRVRLDPFAASTVARIKLLLHGSRIA